MEPAVLGYAGKFMNTEGSVMESMELTKPPVAHTAMLIRRPVSEVFEAIVDPAITSHSWFSKGTGDDLVKFVCESTGGSTWTLAGMKAYLEHGLEPKLVVDRFPKNLDGH